jgi:osmotically-inducible protein OsmY
MPLYWVPYPYPHYRYFPVPGPYRRHGERTDSEIMGDVADALSADPRVDAGEIAFEVDGGIVTLMGTVPVFEQRQLAEEDAWRVPGVVAVHNDLTVPPGTPHPPYDLSTFWPE